MVYFLDNNFKKGAFNLDFKDPRQDDSNYIMLVLINAYNVLELSRKNIGMHSSVSEIDGVLLGTLDNMFGDFEFRVNGVPNITNAEGVSIDKPELYKRYVINGKLEELHYESKSYITVKNKKDPHKYYGVFYSLVDAIKIANENEFVMVGEVTS